MLPANSVKTRENHEGWLVAAFFHAGRINQTRKQTTGKTNTPPEPSTFCRS